MCIRDSLAADGIVLVVILHQVTVEICNVLFHSLINSVCVLQQEMCIRDKVYWNLL